MIFFSISSLLYSISLMFTNFMVIKWIPPVEMGLWNTFLIITSYSFILQLGVLNGLNRELPYFLGKNDINRSSSLASTGLFVATAATIIALLLSIISILYIIYFYPLDIFTVYTLISVAFLVVIYFYQNYLIVTYRTNGAFMKLAKVYLLNSLIIILSLVLVWQYKYSGFLIRVVLLSLILTLGLHIFRPLKDTKPKYNKNSFLLLIKTGAPLFLAGYIAGLSKTLNRVFLANFVGILYVGYYSPALAILVVMNLFPAQIAQYLYPQMSYEYGKTGDKQKLWKWVWKSALGLIALLTPFGIIAWYIVPLAINAFFPDYAEGIFAAQLAIISGIISGSLVGLNVLNSIKAFKTIFSINVTKLLLNIALMYLGVIYFEPLTGVALGLVLSDLLYFLLGLYVTYFNLIKR